MTRQRGKRQGGPSKSRATAGRPRKGGRAGVAFRIARVLSALLVLVLVFTAGLGLGVWLGDRGPVVDAGSKRSTVAAGSDAGGRARPSIVHETPTTSSPPRAAARTNEGGASAARLGVAAPRLTADLGLRPEPPARPPAEPDFSTRTPMPAGQPAADRPVTWLANAVQADAQPGRPMIAIVIDDMGLDRRRSERAVDLPAPLTMAYLAYARDLDTQTRAARAKGHELMVHVPMEPAGEADPGPDFLAAGAGAAAIEASLRRTLGAFDGYIGINNHMGSRFTADADGMRVVLAMLRDRGLLFLDSLTSSRSVARGIGDELATPVVARDVFLDDVDSQEEVIYRLEQAERIARESGTVIAIGHPRDATLAVLERWLAEAPSRGLSIVPVSAVAKARFAARPIKAAAVR